MESSRPLLPTLILAALLLVAMGLAVLGAHYLTLETEGVGVLCGAIFVAALARINQAADHQAELRRLLRDRHV